MLIILDKLEFNCYQYLSEHFNLSHKKVAQELPKMQWIKFTKAPGIRYREHPERTSKPGGRAKDRYWQLVYKYQGKTKVEILGWESECWTESAAIELSAKLAGNRSKGITPGTFAELRATNEA